MRNNGIDRDVKEYAEAGHAFLNNHEGPAAYGWLTTKIGTAFEPVAAADAQRRILAFFNRHLRDSPGA